MTLEEVALYSKPRSVEIKFSDGNLVGIIITEETGKEIRYRVIVETWREPGCPAKCKD